MSDLRDTELVARCRQGDAQAWRLLVHRYQRLIYTVARRAGLDDDGCAEVFQATFVKLHAHLAQIEQPERLQAWLVTTARREMLTLVREARRHVRLATSGDADEPAADAIDQIPDGQLLPPDELERLQLADRVQRALKKLDTRSRDFLVCLFMRDPPMGYEELAQHFDMAPGSVGPTRARCLAKLRQAMESL